MLCPDCDQEVEPKAVPMKVKTKLVCSQCGKFLGYKLLDSEIKKERARAACRKYFQTHKEEYAERRRLARKKANLEL